MAQWWVPTPLDMSSNEGKCEVDIKCFVIVNIVFSTQEEQYVHLPAGCFNILIEYTGRCLLGVKHPKSLLSPKTPPQKHNVS